MLLHHREESDRLFLFVVCVRYRFRNQFFQLRLAEGREMCWEVSVSDIHVDMHGLVVLLRHIPLPPSIQRRSILTSFGESYSTCLIGSYRRDVADPVAEYCNPSADARTWS